MLLFIEVICVFFLLKVAVGTAVKYVADFLNEVEML